MNVNLLIARTIDVKASQVAKLARVTNNVILGWHVYLEINFHSIPCAINLRNLESHATQQKNALMKQCAGIRAEKASIKVVKRNACSNIVCLLMLLLAGHRYITIC